MNFNNNADFQFDFDSINNTNNVGENINQFDFNDFNSQAFNFESPSPQKFDPVDTKQYDFQFDKINNTSESISNFEFPAEVNVNNAENFKFDELTNNPKAFDFSNTNIDFDFNQVRNVDYIINEELNNNENDKLSLKEKNNLCNDFKGVVNIFESDNQDKIIPNQDDLLEKDLKQNKRYEDVKENQDLTKTNQELQVLSPDKLKTVPIDVQYKVCQDNNDNITKNSVEFSNFNFESVN